MKPIDDIKLTAYALGELSTEERKRIEEQLKNNPAQQAEVDEIRALASQLETELQAEPAPELSEEQREVIRNESDAAPIRQPAAWHRWGGFAAVAATVMLVFGGLYWNASRSMDGTGVARLNQDERKSSEIQNEATDEVQEFAALGGRREQPIDAPWDAERLCRELAGDKKSISGVEQMAGLKEDLLRAQAVAEEKPEVPDTSAPVPPDEGADSDQIVLASAAINQPVPDIVTETEMPRSGHTIGSDGRQEGMQVLSARAVGYIRKELPPDAELIALGSPQPPCKDMPPSRARAKMRVSDRLGGGLANGLACNTFVARENCIPREPPNTDSYAQVDDNVFKQIADEPLSTFSIDVDTASYANIRRFLKNGQMPPTDAVRVEEMINYFNYEYAQPDDDVPFAVHVESAACPWNEQHQLVKIGLKGKELDAENRLPCNLVFLLDVSGSMNDPNKLPLVKKAMKLLAKQLSPEDRVSIAVYAGAAGLVLPSTSCDQLPAIESALENLQAGGSTAGGAGIRLAYDEALKNLQTNGVNRVILCTDGDFNVGITDSDELSAFIAERAKKGIFLTVLGFGMGNYKDDRLEMLADKGNGNYAYIDSFSEARKNLAEQAAGTLFTIAKDVKLQIEFNPAHFDSYRLIGYENRVMAKEDFNNDKKDAGELGAGHTVTAFYELVPKGVEVVPGVDPLKYQPVEKPERIEPEVQAEASPEWLTVKLRYKLPDADTSTKIEIPYTGTFAPFESASEDFRFAAGVAGGGLLLRQDARIGTLTFQDVVGWTAKSIGVDPNGYRREYLDLLKNAEAIAP